ncbi:hypothetical protein ANN_06950 [Periplaneta americana]|uniref:Uncharacterized protein n=1 Tax=Periplaneta americana TaxID=6978 RepID=A0ABQ8TF27_PERAM|nr:hypothetical protein ANN_06950 [Periplaneta americana]
MSISLREDMDHSRREILERSEGTPNFSKCKCPKGKKIPSDEREFIVDQRTMRKMVIGDIDLKMTQNIKKKEERKVKEQKKLEKNSFFAHSEKILLSMITDERRDIQQLALRTIIAARHSPNYFSRSHPVCPVVQQEEAESIPTSSYEYTMVHCVLHWHTLHAGHRIVACEGTDETTIRKLFRFPFLKVFPDISDDRHKEYVIVLEKLQEDFKIYSCGYQKAYQDYSNILHEKYPEIIVEGENYNPPGYNMFFAKALGIGKLLLIVCILSGVNIFSSIGQTEPSWWKWCVENKLYSCMMLFFLCNVLEGQLVSTGAFEISFNDVPVWSKIETGRIPQPPELFQIIDNHLQFQTKAELKAGFAK